MRSKTFLSLAIVVIVLSGLVTSSYSIPGEESNVILVMTDGNSNINTLELADFSIALRKSIVFCTTGPREVQNAINVTRFTVDIRDGTLTEEFIETIYETQYVNEFTVIEGNKIHIRTFQSTTPDNKAFSSAFQNELARLQDTDPQSWRTNALAQYEGDQAAIDEHFEWEWTDTREISSLDDGDDWTYEFSYKWDLWRSVPDAYTYKRYWIFDWVVMSKIDSGDYSNDIWFGWCGPWIHERWIKNEPQVYGSSNEELWEEGPTTPNTPWSYDVSVNFQGTLQGPQLQIGASQSWSGTAVTIDDQSSSATDVTEWTESFVGASYALWPISYEPCQASRSTYLSYRGSQWRYTSSDTSFEKKQRLKTTVKFDDNFFWVWFPFVIGYYRYTSYASKTSYIIKS